MKAPLIVFALCAACAGSGGLQAPAPRSGAELVVHMDKTEVFEGEPIYAVIELRNPGRDTVRVAPFSLFDSWMRCLLRGTTLAQYQQPGIIVDYFTGPKYRGDPLAPGESKLQSIVLQAYWGVPGPVDHTLYLRTIPSGTYSFLCSLRPWHQADGRDLTLAAVAPNATFLIRPPHEEEGNRVHEFEGLAARLDVVNWQAETFDTVLAWSARRLAADSADPFVPVVLASALTKATVTGRGADSTRAMHARGLGRAIVAFRPRSAIAAYLGSVVQPRR